MEVGGSFVGVGQKSARNAGYFDSTHLHRARTMHDRVPSALTHKECC